MLFESIDIWKRNSNAELVRYRCFRVLPVNRYCVQSADIYHLPLTKSQEQYFEKQFLELLAEEAPDVRSEMYDSLERAIQMFDRAFGNV